MVADLVAKRGEGMTVVAERERVLWEEVGVMGWLIGRRKLWRVWFG